MNVVDQITRAKISYLYRHLRPPLAITVKLDPKAWFVYAIKCVLESVHEKRYKWSWEHFKKRRDQRKLYIDLHSKLRTETILLEVNYA